jgi:hypothetical protein
MSALGLTVAELADLGVSLISIGGALAGVAWAAPIGADEKINGVDSTDRQAVRPALG